MALDYVTLASNMASAYDVLKASPSVNPGNSWVQSFKTYYDGDATAGTFAPAAVSMTTNQPLLDFVVSNSTNTPTVFAKAITDYWVSQTTPGTPQFAGIISVTNDASKIETPIRYILLGNSTLSTPPYESIFSSIETEVKSIVWTVTENLAGGGTTSYTVKIT